MTAQHRIFGFKYSHFFEMEQCNGRRAYSYLRVLLRNLKTEFKELVYSMVWFGEQITYENRNKIAGEASSQYGQESN